MATLPLEAIFERFLDTYDNSSFCRCANPRPISRRKASEVSTECLPMFTRTNCIPDDSLYASKSIRSNSHSSNQLFKPEDHTAPALDSTAELFADPDVNLNDITVVFCEEPEDKLSRKSSVSNLLCHRRSLCRRRSSFCNTLMRAMSNNSEIPLVSETTKPQLPCIEEDSDKVINFYSFADAVGGEFGLESFNILKGSDVLHAISDTDDDEEVEDGISSLRLNI